MKELDTRYAKIFEFLEELLGLNKGGGCKSESESIRKEWDTLVVKLELPSGDKVAAALLEDLLIHRVLGIRLMRKVGEEGVLPDGKSSTGRGHPGLELWAKNQERYRKIMKELLERLNHGEGESGGNLGELMAPILEKGEGVLEDAMEFEARKKSIKEAGDESGGSAGVAESA